MENFVIGCSNRDCAFCAEDVVTGRMVCSDVPDLMHWVNDNHEFTVRCKRFKPINRRPKSIMEQVDVCLDNWVEDRVKFLAEPHPS